MHGLNPVVVLATNFGKPEALFKKFPLNDVFISSNARWSNVLTR